MKIVSSSFSTFHMFDQAIQLSRHGVLGRFISGPPAYLAARKGIDPTRYESIWPSFAIGYASQQARRMLPAAWCNRMLRAAHDTFSRSLAGRLPSTMDAFIGLSSYCIEALEAANARGVPTVVDHGSLHEAFALKQMQRERDEFGFQIIGNPVNGWLIEKQDREFQAARHVAVLSQFAKRTLVEQGVEAGKIFVNHCGVSLSRFVPGDKHDEVFRVIFCGNVVPGKGVHYLLSAFKALNLPRSELWLIGSLAGVAADPHFEALLKRHLADSRVKCWGGVDAAQLPGLFAQGSVLVLPSLADGFGMVVSQAMACGLPVVVSEHTGAADLVQDGDNGLIVPARDTVALQDALRSLHDEPARARHMGQRGRTVVSTGQGWDDYGDRLVAFLRHITADAGTGGR